MKKLSSKYFKASLAAAAAGLTASAGQASVITIDHNQTLAAADGNVTFDITGDSVDDYAFLFANNNLEKPQITSSEFYTGGINRVCLPVAGQEQRTLPVLPSGQVIDENLFGGVTLNEAFFYRNYEQDTTYYGDWGGPGGIAAPNPVQGPIEGYVGLAVPTDAALTSFNYGYAHFVVDVRNAVGATPSASVTLLDTGYETEVNTAITTPIVPEPSSLAAFVAGAVGLAGLRRRRPLG